MRLVVIALALGSLVVACDKKKDSAGGLPPASKWHQGAESGGGTTGGAAAGEQTNPHAGMDMSGGGGEADPHAGMDMSGGAGMDMSGGDPANPHAGMDMSGGGDPANPHAGMDMSGGGGGAGGPVNPDHVLRGTVSIAPAVKDKVKAGGALYLSVKRPDASGQPTGMPLVVEKLSIDPAGVPFELSEQNAMTGPGTVELSGDVVIVARYDQDGDAFSKQPGDVSGVLKTTVPGKDLKVVLDTVQQ